MLYKRPKVSTISEKGYFRKLEMNDLIIIPQQQGGADILNAIDQAELAEGSRAIYRRAAQKMMAAGVDWHDAQQVRRYSESLKPHEQIALRSALKHVTDNQLWELNNSAHPDNERFIAAAERRLKAIREAVRTHAIKGTKTHSWLSVRELESLILSCSDTPKGRRDAMAIWLMGDCGLRRSEAAAARFRDIRFQDGLPVLGVVGKGAKKRTVPLHRNAHALAMRIQKEQGGEFLLKRFDRHGNAFDGITDRALTDIVTERGQALGLQLAPHDLRRTFAQNRRKAGLDLEQIRVLLGHETLETTRRYLGPLEASTVAREFIFRAAN